MFDVYMPGFDYKNASDQEYAVKAAHLRRIRDDEREKSLR